jgi:Flp pilus assembly pilin Flp
MTDVMTAVCASARRGWRRLVRGSEGASLVEYILLLALVAIVTAASVQQLGGSAKQALNRIGLAMTPADGGADGAAPETGSGSGHGNGAGNGHGNGNGNGGGNGNGNGNGGNGGGNGNFHPPTPPNPPR